MRNTGLGESGYVYFGTPCVKIRMVELCVGTTRPSSSPDRSEAVPMRLTSGLDPPSPGPAGPALPPLVRLHRREDRLSRAVQPPARRRGRLRRLLHHQRQVDHLRQLPRRSREQVGRDRARGRLCQPGEQRGCAGLLLRLPHGEREREPVSGPAGWNVVQDTAYHDVQCESCHGPGVDHVETPDANAPPLARVRVLDADVATGDVDHGYGHRRPAPAPSATAASHHPSSTSGGPPAHARSLVEKRMEASSRTMVRAAPAATRAVRRSRRGA